MIAHYRRIAEITASDRQLLYGNNFQRSGARRRLLAILRFSDSSYPAIVSDYIKTRLYALMAKKNLMFFLKDTAVLSSRFL